MIDRRTVSIRQACALAGVSRRTLYNWMDAGKVEFRYTAGGSRRIYEDSLWRSSKVVAAAGALSEFVPNDRAIWQPDRAKTYQCSVCKRPIFSQFEGEALPMVDCQPNGHLLTWSAST